MNRTSSCFIRFIMLLCVAYLWQAASGRPLAAESPCDPELRPPLDDLYSYRLRGDRCEGIYIKDVAGKNLDLVSLTESFEDFVPGVDKSLAKDI
jgi:hypothetical protein